MKLNLCKYKAKSTFVHTLPICLLLVMGCSHFGTKKTGLGSEVSIKKPIYLRLKALQGRVDKTHHYSNSSVTTQQKGKAEPEVKTEIVEFDISTELLLVDRGKAHLHYLISTLMKKELSGKVDLSELGFPKKDETLSAIYYPNASVVKVDGKSKDSIYHVPPISLPLKPVFVGESWKLNHVWLTAKDRLPLKLELDTKFKSYVNCPVSSEQKRTCAILELSGSIDILGLNQEKVKFTSDIKGLIVFAVEQGSVLWSQVMKSESLIAADSSVNIKSCMVSSLFEPKAEVITTNQKPKCDPKLQILPDLKVVLKK